jgi:hypothetical protein
VGVAVVAIALICVGWSPVLAGAQPTKAAAKCKRALVGGKRVCLKVGQHCQKPFQSDYIAAGFSCRRGKLRRATLAERRGGEPLLLNDKGQLSLDTALAAFDEEIADLPGVEARKGEVGKLNEASYVVDTIAASLKKLTAAQRRVFEAVTGPHPEAITIPVSRRAKPEPRPPATWAKPKYACASQEDTLGEEQLARAAIADARQSLVAHGWPAPNPVNLCFLKDQGGDSDETWAFVTQDDIPPNPSPTCNMFITKVGRSQSDGAKQYMYAHELSHCSQNRLATSKTEDARVPPWVTEGGADWLAGMIRQEHADQDEEQTLQWKLWFDKPSADLFKRQYSALGFWAMIDQTGVDGWQRLRAAHVAATTGGKNAAYSTAISGLPDVFNARWGPGYVMKASLGDEWAYTGPSIPQVPSPEVKISNGSTKSFSIAAHSGFATRLDVTADVVTLTPTKGTRGLLNLNGKQRDLEKGAYCAKNGGCKCKTNTNLQLPQLDGPAYLGFGDAHKARTVTVAGRSLKDYCKKPNPGPASSSCATGVTTARGTGDSCPAPDPFGIQVFMGAENPVVVATFTIGDCTAGPGGFTAISTSGAWRLEVGMTNFAGFGRQYDIPYGGGDPEVILDGPGGTYSNATWEPGGLPNAGAIALDEQGRRMGLAIIEFRTADQSSAIGAAGGMTCVYPTD